MKSKAVFVASGDAAQPAGRNAVRLAAAMAVSLACAATAQAAGDAAVSRLPGGPAPAITAADIAAATPIDPRTPVSARKALLSGAKAAATGRSASAKAGGTVAGNPGPAGAPKETEATGGSVDTLPKADAKGSGDISAKAAGDSDHPFTTALAGSVGSSAPVNLFPWRATGKVYTKFTDGNTYVCSGALIDRGLLVTAARCVWRYGSNTHATSLTFRPALNGTSRPFGEYKATGARIYVPTVFKNGDDDCDSSETICANDVAVVALQSSGGKYAGDRTGWYGYAWDGYGFTSFFDASMAQITELGYPLAFNNGNRMIRTDSMGYLSSHSNVIIGSRQGGGSNGGPLLVNFGNPVTTSSPAPADAGANRVVGVVNWAYETSGGTLTGDYEQGGALFGYNDAFQSKSNIVALTDAACADYPSNCAD